MNVFDVIIVGGGAAGFFTAINIAEQHPKLKIVILERGKEVLTKVKISGGGRCNVTHAEFIPKALATNYPRGEKELLGPFHQFMTGDTMEWFEKRGVSLKIEEDGRCFPESNSSQTIIDCFLKATSTYGISILKNNSVKQIVNTNTIWEVQTNQNRFQSNKLVIATGSNPKIWNVLNQLGHSIVQPVPSLFSFNINDSRIATLQGLVANDVEITIKDTSFTSEGPLLITHKGMSAPSILKLSALAARYLAQKMYKFKIIVNFIKLQNFDCVASLKEKKQQYAKKNMYTLPQFNLPKRLWHQLLIAANIPETLRWAECNNKQLQAIALQLTSAEFCVNGKSTFKDEFVTAGGVDLKEINFKTFESKRFKNLYFSGEVLNIDAVTGGFNFQNAWTGGFIVAKHINSF